MHIGRNLMFYYERNKETCQEMKVTEVILKHKITTYMHVYTDPQLGNIFFNSVKLISMSTNSSRY
jgi:4-hydroxyphenylpyruvate dioxygenase-like putative hemolysin